MNYPLLVLAHEFAHPPTEPTTMRLALVPAPCETRWVYNARAYLSPFAPAPRKRIFFAHRVSLVFPILFV
eukprot:1962000-Pyramimonas_sp.AAC.2